MVSKLLAASAVAALALSATAAQAAIYVAYDLGLGGGIVGEQEFLGTGFDIELVNLGGFNTISLEGVGKPLPSLLHSDNVSYNASGAAGITLYVTRTGLTYLPTTVKTKFTYNTDGLANVDMSVLADDDDGKYVGDLLSFYGNTGDGAYASTQFASGAGLSGTYSITHKYVISTSGGQSSSSPTIATGAIPEPGTWGLMIMGFGGAGALLRRRRSAALAA